MVTLDTTRADRLGAYGHAGAHTPTIDRLAREGLLFENALASTPTTLPSHASILTGTAPPAHGVRDNLRFALGPEAELLPEVLRREGWRTGGFVGAFVLDPRFGLDQGFERYGASGLSEGAPERRARLVVKEAIAWLDGLEPGEPFFLWVHFFDPHWPFAPPARWKDRVRDAYDAEIAYCDEQLARLLSGLAERGLDGNLLSVVTADHGEALGEHGEISHGLFLYQSTLRVPLILHGPPVASAAGTRVERFVSVADLPATLLELAGLPRSELPEASPFPLVDAAGRPAAGDTGRAFYLETLTPFHSYGWRGLRGVVVGDYKLVDGAAEELYALREDPGETLDLGPREPERAAALRARLDEAAAQPELGWGRRRGVSSDEAERLEMLGYVVGVTSGDPFAPGLPDAAARAADLAEYAKLEAKMREGRALLGTHDIGRGAQGPEAARGLSLVREVRDGWAALHAADAGNPYVALRLGLAESLLGNHAGALEPLEQARAHDGRNARLLYYLALAYETAGRVGEAGEALRTAVEVAPDEPFYGERLEAFRARHPTRDARGSARIQP